MRHNAFGRCLSQFDDYVWVNIEAALKLGNFTMTFVDLEVPVAGLPITVTRTYDTLAAEKKDEFGYGWSLDVANTRVEIQMDPYRRTDFSGYKPFRDGDCVVITLPDGTQEGLRKGHAFLPAIWSVRSYEDGRDAFPKWED